jgi:hypothetical protein
MDAIANSEKPGLFGGHFAYIRVGFAVRCLPDDPHEVCARQRGIICERVNAGLARARANGVKLGRRRVKPSVEARILELRANGDGILKIGRKLGVGTSVVQRVFKQEPWQS